MYEMLPIPIFNKKVSVSTVHKAKGLEFENVIIFEATDGIYPFWFHCN